MGCFPQYSRTCNHVLPTVFEESLSYEEQICKLIYCMQELENIVNNIQDLNKEYVDNKFKEANAYTDNSINTLRVELTKQFTDKINEMYKYVNEMDGELRADLLTEIARVEEEIDNIVLGQINIFDPTVGYKRNIDLVINSIYNVLRVWGLTAGEYDGLKLTAKAYDNYNLTARQYDVFAKRYIYKNPAHYMNSPFNGEYETLQQVISEIVKTKKTTSISAKDYDALGWTAQVYDEKKITAYNYDWNFKSFFFYENYATPETVITNPNLVTVGTRMGGSTTIAISPTNDNLYIVGYQIDTTNLIGKQLSLRVWGVTQFTSKLHYNDEIIANNQTYQIYNNFYTNTIDSAETNIYLEMNNLVSQQYSTSINFEILIEK